MAMTFVNVTCPFGVAAEKGSRFTSQLADRADRVAVMCYKWGNSVCKNDLENSITDYNTHTYVQHI